LKKLEKGTNVVEDDKKINKHNQSIVCEENWITFLNFLNLLVNYIGLKT
jgi:hypothetical protein